MRLKLSIALIAGAALGYQLLLMRLLGIVHWHPFAALIISLALLGHGASGSWLALRAPATSVSRERAYVGFALAFALLAPLCFALAQRLPFNGLELVWNPRQALWLGALFLLLSLPFFCAAVCLGLALMLRPQRVGGVYAADLLGAGLGAVVTVLLLYRLAPQDVLRAVAIAATAGVILLASSAGRPRLAIAVALLAASAAALWPADWLRAQPSAFKALPRTLLLPGARIVAERSSPLGWLAVVDSPQVPLRHVPGLSLTALQEPAAQLGVFLDGDAPGVITRRGDDPARLAYLGQLTTALPYALLDAPRVLVLGAGGGSDVLQALTLGARAVVAVELNAQLADLVLGPFAAWSGDLYRDPRVQLQIADPRRFLRAGNERFDLIQLAPADSAGGSAAGVQASAESSLYTLEALDQAYAHLTPGGWLALTRWSKQPPRDSLKLLATAATLLRERGLDPAAQLALVRSWQTDTLLLRRGTIGAREQAAIRDFCRHQAFDLVYLPGLRSDEGNRYHRLREDRLREGVQALLGPGAAAYIAAYKFDIRPARDDRPFFHDFFRWRALPELWALRRSGAAVLLDAGTLLVLAALLVALPLSLLLVLLPLSRLRERTARPALARSGAYFTCLGLGFLFVEIAALSRIGLLLGDPLLAATLVLAAMLVFAGLGSALSARFKGRSRLACTVVAAAIVLALIVQALCFEAAAVWPLSARLLVAAAWLAPLALLMGLPFPLALSRLSAQQPALIPWAWGVNGCASVLSPLLAMLLAMQAGLSAVMLAAALLYLAAAMFSLPRRGDSAARP